MGRRLRVLTGAIMVAIYIFNPFSIRTSILTFVGSLTTFANLAPVVEPDSLKAAISNVTGDFDQLSNILQDFFERMPENTTELLFRDFLMSKASRRHKDLERYLDWLLGFYRFAWPFLVRFLSSEGSKIVYIILKLSSGSAKSDLHDPPKASDFGRRSRKKYESSSEARPKKLGDEGDNLPSSLSRQGRSSSAQSFG